MTQPDGDAYTALLRELAQLRTAIGGLKGADTRTWLPDDSCAFFNLSSCLLVGAGGTILNFTVPRNSRGVIARVTTRIMNPAATSNKNNTNIRFRPGDSNEQHGHALHGSLMEVVEQGLGTFVQGIAAPADVIQHECRIVLYAGPWECFNGGDTQMDAGSLVELFGWTFPAAPRV